MQGDEELDKSSVQTNETELESLTRPHDWDYSRFRSVLINLGSSKNNASIPARNRPDSINIKGIREDVEELKKMSNGNGKEHSRAILVDS